MPPKQQSLPDGLSQFLKKVYSLRKRLEFLEAKTCILQEKSGVLKLNLNYKEENGDDDINNLLTLIYKEAMTFQNELKNLKELHFQSNNGKEEPNSERIKNNHISYLTRGYMNAMKKCQQIELEIKKIVKDKISHEIKIYNPQLDDELIHNKIENGEWTQLNTKEKPIDEDVLLYMKKRHKDIISINDSIHELNELFVNASILIDMQGEAINSIEKNCAQIQEYTARTTQTLERTYHFKKKQLWFVYLLNKKSHGIENYNIDDTLVYYYYTHMQFNCHSHYYIFFVSEGLIQSLQKYNKQITSIPSITKTYLSLWIEFVSLVTSCEHGQSLVIKVTDISTSRRELLLTSFNWSWFLCLISNFTSTS